MLMVMRNGRVAEPDEEDIAAIKKWLRMTPAERKQIEKQALRMEQEQKEKMALAQKARKRHV